MRLKLFYGPLGFIIFCFIQLAHEGSHREVYQEFQHSYDIVCEDQWTWKRYAKHLTHDPLVRGDHKEGAVLEYSPTGIQGKK